MRLRQWSADDVSFVFDMCSRWEVQRYIGANPRVLLECEEAVDLIDRWQSRQDGLHRVWAVEHVDGHLLGTLLLVAICSGTPPLQPTGEPRLAGTCTPTPGGRATPTRPRASVWAAPSPQA